MTSGNFDGDTLKVFFNRIVNLEKEKRAEAANFQADIKQVYAEAKDFGFTPKIIRGLVAEHLAPQKDQEDLDLEAIYRDALGLGGTPLDKAAKKAGKDNAGAAGEDESSEDEALSEPDPEVTAEQIARTAMDKPGPKGAAPIPDALAAARGIVRKATNNRLDAAAAGEGAVQLQKSDTARGSVEKAMWSADEALLAAGWTRAGANKYAAPAAAEGL